MGLEQYQQVELEKTKMQSVDLITKKNTTAFIIKTYFLKNCYGLTLFVSCFQYRLLRFRQQ